MMGQQVSGVWAGSGTELLMSSDIIWSRLRTLLLCNTDSGTMGAIWYSFSMLEAMVKDGKLSLVVLMSELGRLSFGA